MSITFIEIKSIIPRYNTKVFIKEQSASLSLAYVSAKIRNLLITFTSVLVKEKINFFR